ncbi:hypothetical protein [Dongia deserti]|uniref:hypothetical protein n=1 Tax=Dongia deserti TaxID=2268030 RepID=UPI000E650BB5|nr:hypothetical protein [Dongia deserti]
MLTLSHLANLIALLYGERPETMQLIARNLRQARLVASGGRGRGGARQEPRHVANMIIAACASDQVADVASAVSTFANLEVTATRQPRGRLRTRGAPDHDAPKELLFATRKGVQFGGVLSALVDMAASGDLYTLLMAYSGEFVDRDLLRAGAEAIRRAPRGKKPDVTAEFAARMATHVQALIDQSVVYLTISVERPLPRARIEFGTRPDGDPSPLLRADFGLPARFIANARNAQRLNAWSRIDRCHRVTLSHRTLLSVGQAIAAEQGD